MTQSRKLIVFDVDGTLVDSQDEIVEAQIKALAAHGLPPPSRETALSVVGLSLREAFAVLVGRSGPLDSLAETYKVAWTELRSRPGYRDKLYPGAGALIDSLAEKPEIRLGIATGKSRAGVDRILGSQGWTRAFATIQTADTHPSKPDPSMVRAAVAEAGAGCIHTIVVGDTTYDMEMAASAGAKAIGVAWGYHPAATLAKSGALAVAQDVGQLRAILDTFSLDPD